MIDFRQKRKLRTVLSSRYVQAVLVVVLVLVGINAFERFQIAQQMADRRETAVTEATNLELRRQQLEEQVRYLDDDRGIEAELRRQFDVSREGEQVVVIVDPEPPAEVEPLGTSTANRRAWYEFWR